jgi:osmotically-inducible protein OsmY
VTFSPRGAAPPESVKTRRIVVKLLLRSVPIVALIASGPLVAACQNNKSPDVESRVQDRLKSADIKDVNANWKKDENTLHLTGEVKAPAEKQRAEELANEVVGTSGRVVNEVKVEGVDTDNLDSRIEKELDRMFKEDDEWDRDTNDLTFHSNAGVVTIKGDASSEAVKDNVTARVRSVEGVKDVVNDLQIKTMKEPNAKNTKAHTKQLKKKY